MRMALLILASGSLSCSSQQAFNEAEVRFLNQLSDIFFNAIGEEADLNKRYAAYCKQVDPLVEKYPERPIAQLRSTHIDKQIDNLDTSYYTLMWNVHTVNGRTMFNINSESKFVRLLSEKGTSNKVIRHWVERVQTHQGFVPSDIVHMTMHPDQYDLEQQEVKWMVAVTFLALAYNAHRY